MDPRRAREAPQSTDESFNLSPSNDGFVGTRQVGYHGSDIRSSVDQDSDGSDSDAFRVKRRSLEAGRRIVNRLSPDQYSEQQVLLFPFTFVSLQCVLTCAFMCLSVL